MSLKLSFELSDRDLQFFREALKQSRAAVRDAEEAEIIDAIRVVLDEIRSNEPLPDFVEQRIPTLEAMLQMLLDEEWQIPANDREHLLATFVYFADPEDVLPDDIPVIGYLDDVIILELTARKLVHVLEAYAEFCVFRDDYDKKHDDKIDAAVRRDRLDKQRQKLHQRMRQQTAREPKNEIW